MVLYSPPINIIRYSNGTLVKLTASRHDFVSYNYDPETKTGTFLPDLITITAKLSGNIQLGEWQYSDSGDFRTLTNMSGLTINGISVSIEPDSAIFRQSDTVTIRAIADDGIHDDTITISRIVDPKIVYDKTYTSIEQTNDKISLIASEEQLAQLSEEETFITRYSEYLQEAGLFRQTVESSYATKTYAENQASTAASGAVSTANAYADGKLSGYYTKTELTTIFEQTENSILESVSESYATKSEVQRATNGTYTLETPYLYNNRTYTFNAIVYRNAENVTVELNPSQFVWTKRSENYEDQEYIGTGKSITISDSSIGYGGTVVCRLVLVEEGIALTTEEDNNLTTETGQNIEVAIEQAGLTTETTLYRQGYLENKFAEIKVTTDSITSTVESNKTYAEEYADNAAEGAIESSNGYTDDKLTDYITTEQARSEIRQESDSITASVEATYATKQEVQRATDGVYTLETPYRYTNNKYYFDARVYRNSENVTSELNSNFFTWYKRSEEYADIELIGTGTTVEIPEESLGYGGTVVCRFICVSDPEPLTIETGAYLTDEYGEQLEVVNETAGLTTETTLYRKDYLKSQFAQIKVTTDSIVSEVRHQEQKFDNDLTEQWSRIEQGFGEINTEVGKKVGQNEIISSINQTPESISISANKLNLNGAITANGNVHINEDGSIDMVSGHIGQINIGSGSIYSTGHATVGAGIRGFILDANGNADFGNGSSYMRFSGDSFEFKTSGAELKSDGSLKVTNGKIGDIIIDQSTIHTASYEQGQSGFNFTSDGTVFIGDSENYFLWDGSALSIVVESLKIGREDAATQEDVEGVRGYAEDVETAANNAATKADSAYRLANTANTAASTAQSTAEDAAKTATNFLTYTPGSGLTVSASDLSGSVGITGTGVTVSGTGGSVSVESGGVTISAGNQSATFTSNSISFGSDASIGTDGLDVKKGKMGGFTVDGSSLSSSNGNVSLSGSGSTFISAGSYFSVGSDGTTSITNGTIGGFTLNGGVLEGSGMKVDPGGLYMGSRDEYNIVSGIATLATVAADRIEVGTSHITGSGSTAEAYFSRDAVIGHDLSVGNDLDVGGKATLSGGAAIPADSNEGSTKVLCYDWDGVTVAWCTISSGSSRRYKNVHRLASKEDVERFYDVKPVIASYKDGHHLRSEKWAGVKMPMLIAEEVEKAYPNCTLYDRDGLVMDYDHHLIGAVHQQMLIDQRNKIQFLEEEVSSLKAEIDELKTLLREVIK